MLRRLLTLLASLLAGAIMPPLLAQASADSLKIGDVVVSGSLRTRIESWDWFECNANNEYTFPGSIFRLSFSQSTKQYDWQLEFALPFLLGLHNDAIALGPQRQLGFGTSYFAANNGQTNAALPFVKQASVRFKILGGLQGQSLKVGRMEFIDGAEVAPANTTLAAVKRERIAQRLLANFAFSDVGRSFDGAQYVLNSSKLNLTMFGGRPTRGDFQVDGWGEININVFYGALTGQIGGKRSASEWRLFGLGYADERANVVKVDDRPLALRRADTGHIQIGT